VFDASRIFEAEDNFSIARISKIVQGGKGIVAALSPLIVHEDNHQLVIFKPSGWLSQGDETGDLSVNEIFQAYLKEKYQKPGNVFCAAVQRLDRPACGLMVLARTSKAAARISEFGSWTPDVVRIEADKFRDFWHSKSGKDAAKMDWQATWRNWCRSDICQRSHPPPGQTSETPYARQMRERVAEAAGSFAHIVAAKAPGQQSKPSPTPWDVAIENNRRTIATGVGGCDLLEAVDDLRS
jgi:hypothetical protein